MKRATRKLNYLLYVLPLFVFLFTAQVSSAVSPNYEGEALYKRYCTLCHDTGTGGGVGALPLYQVVGKGDSLAKLKNSITIGKNSANVTTYMNTPPYTTLTDAQLQDIVNYTTPVPTSPLPTTLNLSPLSPSETTVRSATLASSIPMAVGNSTTFKWQYNLPLFSGKVDIIYALVGPSGLWLNTELAQDGDLNKIITEIPTTLLQTFFPTGTTLTLYLAVVPQGHAATLDLTSSYIWSTTYTVQ